MHFTAVSKGDKIAFMITYIYIMGYNTQKPMLSVIYELIDFNKTSYFSMFS